MLGTEVTTSLNSVVQTLNGQTADSDPTVESETTQLGSHTGNFCLSLVFLMFIDFDSLYFN
jgi:hypothetical protein